MVGGSYSLTLLVFFCARGSERVKETTPTKLTHRPSGHPTDGRRYRKSPPVHIFNRHIEALLLKPSPSTSRSAAEQDNAAVVERVLAREEQEVRLHVVECLATEEKYFKHTNGVVYE